jgi:DtxR family transcriptional regulator, Mn-dependent transcriptional regulator
VTAARGHVRRDPAAAPSETCCDLSPSMEDYLKAVFHLEAEAEPVTTSAIADRVQVAPPSVSAMVRRLRHAGLVADRPSPGLRLTSHGRRHAQRVVRRHRLIETFLAEVLDMTWDEVHEEAERLEHVIGSTLEERIAARLGEPTHDPHGDPIPPREGAHDEAWPDPLDAAPTGSWFVVERVSDRDSDALRYLDRLGIRPGTRLLVAGRGPFGGPLWVEIDGVRHALGHPLAGLVHGSVEAQG